MKRFLVSLALSLGALVFPAVAHGASYTVQSGDWLSKVFPSNWQQVCSHNQLPDCNRIEVGQVLDVPEGNAPAPAPQIHAAGGVPGLSLVLGKPYVYGGVGLSGFDCSGLTQFLAAQRGIPIPRTSQAQIAALRHIPLSQAVAGDIIALNYNHVGILLGDGRVVQALNPSVGVLITTVQDAIAYNGFLTALAVGR